MFFANKKGVSPLIATILLILFAIALGSVIMNVGVKLSPSVCDDVSITPLIVEGIERVCVTNNTLSFAVTNDGSQIQGVKVIVIGDTVEEKDFFATTPTHSTIADLFSFTLTDPQVVQIIPIVNDGDELTYCPSKKQEVISFQTC